MYVHRPRDCNLVYEHLVINDVADPALWYFGKDMIVNRKRNFVPDEVLEWFFGPELAGSRVVSD